MRRDSVIFAISGIFFGLILGWMIGIQQGGTRAPQAAQAAQAPAAPQAQGSASPVAVLDEGRVRGLTAAAEQRPQDAAVRVELGNLYFDAQRFPDAIKWYEDALKVDPKNVNASTDLGVSYYYLNQPDRALAQFDKSLAIDGKHAKTLLNMGVVRAFGKQDLKGAAEAWERVIALAPNSEEGRAAKQALDSMKGAHPGLDGAAPAQGGPGTE
jgi:tetratricopeptide (TPR) repeat protein